MRILLKIKFGTTPAAGRFELPLHVVWMLFGGGEGQPS